MRRQQENSEIGIEVKITDSCNQYCFHCMNNDSVSNGIDLNIEFFLRKFEEWINSSQEIGVNIREVRITGGEPLLRTDAVMRIAYLCQSASIRCGMNTNATLLTAEVAQKLKKAGMKIIKISLDAANEEVFKKVRGKNASLEKVHAGIRNAVNNDFYVILRFTLCELNKDQLISCYEAGRDMGVDRFQVKPLIPAGRGFSSKALLNQTQIFDVIKQLNTKVIDDSLPWEVLCWISEMDGGCETKVCGSIDKVYIKTNFDIITCNYLSETLPIGNMLEDSFSGIYSNRIACNIMKSKGISVLEKCPQLAALPTLPVN